jgi:hypothetical protein
MHQRIHTLGIAFADYRPVKSQRLAVTIFSGRKVFDAIVVLAEGHQPVVLCEVGCPVTFAARHRLQDPFRRYAAANIRCLLKTPRDDTDGFLGNALGGRDAVD